MEEIGAFSGNMNSLRVTENSSCRRSSVYDDAKNFSCFETVCLENSFHIAILYPVRNM
jgi:hypothetical protein